MDIKCARRALRTVYITSLDRGAQLQIGSTLTFALAQNLTAVQKMRNPIQCNAPPPHVQVQVLLVEGVLSKLRFCRRLTDANVAVGAPAEWKEGLHCMENTLCMNTVHAFTTCATNYSRYCRTQNKQYLLALPHEMHRQHADCVFALLCLQWWQECPCTKE